MTDIEVTTGSSKVKNVYNQNAEMVLIGPIAKAAQNDTVTLTDVKKTKWVYACTTDSSNDIVTDAVTVDYSNDPGEYQLTDSTTGTSYILAVIERE